MITVAGLFAHVSQARQVVLDLVTSGIPHEDIGILLAEDVPVGTGSAQTGGMHRADFIATLIGVRSFDLEHVGRVVAAGPLAAGAEQAARSPGANTLTAVGVAHEQAHKYIEGLRQGGTVVLVQSDEARATTIEGVFRHHTVLADEHGREGLDQDDGLAAGSVADRVEGALQAPSSAPADVDAPEEEPPISTSIGTLTGGLVTGGFRATDEIFNPPERENDKS